MAGRRHHTIPQFMLRPFATEIRGSEAMVWLYRHSKDAIEVNTKNVSVERDFYGKELDDRITAVEAEFASLADELRRQSGPVENTRVPDFVAHMTLRTRSLRQCAIDLAATMADSFGQHLSQPAVLRAAVRQRYTKRELLDRLREELVKMGFSRVEIERRILAAGPEVLKALQQKLDESAEVMAAVAGDAIRKAAKQLPSSMRTNMNETFLSALDDNPRIEAYRRFKWTVIPCERVLVLGDSVCVFETFGTPKFRRLDDEDHQAKRILMPLSPDRLLVGNTDAEQEPLTERQLNEVSVRCSLEFFVSARRLEPTDAHLAQTLGTWAKLLTEEEQREILSDFKQDYPTKP